MVEAAVVYPNSGFIDIPEPPTHLSLISNPTHMPSARYCVAGRITVNGVVTENGFKVKRWGSGKSGNEKNAGWRHPHGGAFCSPINKNLQKGKTARSRG